jgi:hypothetical protein
LPRNIGAALPIFCSNPTRSGRFEPVYHRDQGGPVGAENGRGDILEHGERRERSRPDVFYVV